MKREDELRIRLSTLINSYTDYYCPGTNFNDLEIDSLDLIDIINQIEYEFNIKIPNNTLKLIKNEEELIQLINATY